MRQDISKLALRWASDGPRGAQDGPKSAQERPKRPQESPKRLPNCPQEGSTMVPRGLQDAPRARDRKGLDIDSCRVVVVVVVVIVIVVVFALFFLVVVPFVLPCSSREHRPTTPDNQCTSQRWLF